jgi:Cu/Ag efflux pump CusA
VIGGVVAMSKLPIAQLPDIVPPQVNVAALYTGPDALTIEQSVATPLEQQMNGVDTRIEQFAWNLRHLEGVSVRKHIHLRRGTDNASRKNDSREIHL